MACVLSATALPVGAQQYFVFPPGSSRPSVIVDLSVLDKLGPEPTLPGMLRSGRPPLASASKGGLLPPPVEPPRSQLSLPKGFASRRTPTNDTSPKPAIAALQPRRSIPAAPTVSPPKPVAPKMVERPKIAPPPKISTPAPKAPAPAQTARVTPKVTPPPPPKRKPVTAKPSVPKVVKPSVPVPQKLTIVPPAAPKVSPPRPAKVPPPPPVAKRPTMPKPAMPRVPAPARPSTASKPDPKPNVPPAPTVKSKAPQIAAKTPPTDTGPDGTIRIGFNQKSSDLPSSATGALDKLVARMASDAGLRVQLHGYANGKSDSPSQARRLSLFRALSVRTYLMKKGVRSTRIDVRALGKKDDGEAANRVDVIIQKS